MGQFLSLDHTGAGGGRALTRGQCGLVVLRPVDHTRLGLVAVRDVRARHPDPDLRQGGDPIVEAPSVGARVLAQN